MAYQLRFPNKLDINAGTLNLTAKDIAGNYVAPIITNSTMLCANLYCERSLYSDSTGNIVSPPFNITNSPSAGDLLTAINATDAAWTIPSFSTPSLTIENSPSFGYVLTGNTSSTALWAVPGTVQGNIYGDIITANSLVLAGPLTATTGTFSGEINVTGNITATDTIFADTVDVTNVVTSTLETGTIHATGNIDGDIAVNVSTVVATDVNALSLNIANNAFIGGAVTGVDSLVASGNITAANFVGPSTVTHALKSASTNVIVKNATAPSVGQALVALSSTAASWQDIGTATAANALKSATTTINVSSATAPSANQILTASSSTAAVWAAPANQLSGAAPIFGITTVAITTNTTTTLTTSSTYFQYISPNGAGYTSTVKLPSCAAGTTFHIIAKGSIYQMTLAIQASDNTAMYSIDTSSYDVAVECICLTNNATTAAGWMFKDNSMTSPSIARTMAGGPVTANTPFNITGTPTYNWVIRGLGSSTAKWNVN